MTQKNEWRKIYLQKRKAISPERRVNASIQILRRLILLNRKGKILSFNPMGSEIDISRFNKLLFREKKLLLPNVKDHEIIVPDEPLCIILVPAIAFDHRGYRIGYGGGFYDRFLEKMGHVHTIGLGFIEQLSDLPIPKDRWDISVKELILI